MFAKEIMHISRRRVATRFTYTRYWHELDSGGHFAVTEQPGGVRGRGPRLLPARALNAPPELRQPGREQVVTVEVAHHGVRTRDDPTGQNVGPATVECRAVMHPNRTARTAHKGW